MVSDLMFVILLCFLIDRGLPVAGCSESFSSLTSTRLVYYAYATYCGSSAIGAWNCEWCKHNPNFQILDLWQTDAKALGYIGYDPTNNEVLVVFRGTADWTNIGEDLDAILSSSPFLGIQGAFVHSGMLKMYQTLRNSAIQSIMTHHAKYPQARLRLTGHSAGAALATLCALELSYTYKVGPVYLHTFGSPRVGVEAFASAVKSAVCSSWRVVNAKDPVPHLPPLSTCSIVKGIANDVKALWKGLSKDVWSKPQTLCYHHVPSEVWITNGQSHAYKTCNNEGEDSTCSDSLTVSVDVSDHRMYWGINSSIYSTCNYNYLGSIQNAVGSIAKIARLRTRATSSLGAS